MPTDTFGALVPVLARLRAAPGPPETRGALCVLEGEVPAARVHELQQLLPGLTRGEGALESAFAGHRPVTGPVPNRPRTAAPLGVPAAPGAAGRRLNQGVHGAPVQTAVPTTRWSPGIPASPGA
ncbi:hypothetical protein [Streptomyces sp. NPDC088706]|uniref:hypothetical protein n=1 Tax=Streptomyces sp. NPDC088706 TaxID=3365870 RepID=UPI0038239CE2